MAENDMWELVEFVPRVGAGLRCLTDEQTLTVSAANATRHGRTRYVRFERSAETMGAVTTGAANLVPGDHLAEEDLEILHRLGWKDPGDDGDHHRRWTSYDSPEQIAAMALATLSIVHGVTEWDDFAFSSNPDVLAAIAADLDAMWQTSERAAPSLCYYDYDRTAPLDCGRCGPIGRNGADEQSSGDDIAVRCPWCARLLVTVELPTLDDARRAAAAGNLEAAADVARIEADMAEQQRREASLLRAPSQLGDISASVVVIDWDLELTAEHALQILHHEGTEVWTEAATYGGHERFAQVFAILRERYGDRFAELRPTERSLAWLYGDSLDAPGVIDGLRRSTEVR